MAVTNYHAVNGEIVGETTSGVRTDYLVDALGSVTGTVNQSAQVQNTYRYKPYGALPAKTGTGPDPKSQWVGTLGYRATGRPQSDYYVRARHYGSALGRWTTVDPLWPWAAAYDYAASAPAALIDPSGLISFSGPQCNDTFRANVRALCDRVLAGDLDRAAAGINDCIEHTLWAGGRGTPNCCPALSPHKLNCLKAFCKKGNVECKPMDTAGNTPWPFLCPGNFDEDSPAVWNVQVDLTATQDTFDPNTEDPLGTFIHEMLHACGVDHVLPQDSGRDVKTTFVCNNILDCCIHEELYGPRWIKMRKHWYEWCPYWMAVDSARGSLNGVWEWGGSKPPRLYPPYVDPRNLPPPGAGRHGH